MPPVTIQLDFCFNLLPIPLCAPHNYIPCPPFPPVPPPMPGAVLACQALEIPVPAWWPPGYALGGASFTTTVFHKFMQICLEGHDCGKFIPHIQLSPAPNNTLTLVHIPLSKRSANFASSTVKMNGKGVAAMTLISWPPCPMTYCAEPVSLPLADATTSHLNTVRVGITLADWSLGAVAIAAGILMDWFFLKRSGGAGKKLLKEAEEMALKSEAGKYVYQLVAKKLVGGIAKPDLKFFVKQGVGLLTGAARALVLGEGSGSISYEIGGPFLGLKGSVGFKKAAGKDTAATAAVKGTALTASGEVNEGGTKIANNHPLGLGSESRTAKWGEPGASTEQTSVEPFQGFQNTNTKTTPDGKATTARSRGPAATPLVNAL
jgi:hypothetical protein